MNMKKLAIFIATGFGSGYLPWAPGSWGAAAMLFASWWLIELPLFSYLGLIFLLFVVGIGVAEIADKHFAQTSGNTSDNDKIVIDEWVGMLITLLPLFYFEKSLLHFAMAFLFFRIFDTLKFGLAKIMDRLHSRWGVMLDDVFAGLHAGIFFFIALWVMYKI